jgi:hypothetical protein
MTILAALLIAKLLDPVIIALAIFMGMVCRERWHIVMAALGIATIQETLLSTMQMTRAFNPASFLVGVFAAAAWVALVFFIRRRRSQTVDNANEPNGQRPRSQTVNNTNDSTTGKSLENLTVNGSEVRP